LHWLNSVRSALRKTAPFAADDARVGSVEQVLEEWAANDACLLPEDEPFDGVVTCPLR